jgi:Glycosyl transferase family 2
MRVPSGPRVVALLATYNEQRFVAACLEHLGAQGVETYLIDNCSTDETVAIAERFRGAGLIGVEQFPRDGVYDWRGLLRRKEQLAGELEADWFIHLDADELRLPPVGEGTLAEALATADREGYNAVNFFEFTFVPTREAADHDHADFRRTLRTYYPFCPSHPNQLKAWKASAAPKPDLASSGGHRVSFPGLRMYPRSFPMKHYLFLSVPHAVEKYVERDYDADEVESGWHGWRATLTAADIHLPSESELRVTRSDEDLDAGEPRRTHYLDDRLRAGSGGGAS